MDNNFSNELEVSQEYKFNEVEIKKMYNMQKYILNIFITLMILLLPLSNFSQNYFQQIFENWRERMGEPYEEVDIDEEGKYFLKEIDVMVDSLTIVTPHETIIYYWQYSSIDGTRLGIFMKYIENKYLEIIFGFHTLNFQQKYEYFYRNKNTVRFVYSEANMKRKEILRKRKSNKSAYYYPAAHDFP